MKTRVRLFRICQAIALVLMIGTVSAVELTENLFLDGGLEPAKQFRAIQVEGVPAAKTDCQGNRLNVVISSRQPVLIVIGKMKDGDR